jgi:prevent-host-death family protein
MLVAACPPSEEKLSERYWDKSDLSVIEQALTNGPQTITRNERDAVVVVSAEEWESKTKRKGIGKG